MVPVLASVCEPYIFPPFPKCGCELHMPERSSARSLRRRVASWMSVALALWCGGAAAADRRDGLAPRVVVATCQSPQGSLLSRAEVGKAWEALGAKDDVYSRDLLLSLPGARGVLETRDGSVRLTLWGNTPEMSTFPVLDSAVVLNDSRAYDLDFTLNRGRVVLTNIKKKGAARVWVRLPAEGWDLTLAEPGDEVALELTGR